MVSAFSTEYGVVLGQVKIELKVMRLLRSWSCLTYWI